MGNPLAWITQQFVHVPENLLPDYGIVYNNGGELIKSSEISGSSHRRSAILKGHHWARVEAARCLGCYDAPCILGCPTRINIPEFIGRIRVENLAGASDTLVQ